jgi:hypothetical protein
MHPVGFEPTIPANTRPQTYVFDNAATGISSVVIFRSQKGGAREEILGNTASDNDAWGFCLQCHSMKFVVYSSQFHFEHKKKVKVLNVT